MMNVKEIKDCCMLSNTIWGCSVSNIASQSGSALTLVKEKDGCWRWWLAFTFSASGSNAQVQLNGLIRRTLISD